MYCQLHHICACSDDEHDDNDDDEDDEDDEDDDEAVQEGQLTETMPQFLETGRRLQQRSKSVHCLPLLFCVTVFLCIIVLHYCLCYSFASADLHYGFAFTDLHYCFALHYCSTVDIAL